jgi:hypothetical protein
MATPADNMAQFLESRASPGNYPRNIARTEIYRHGLDSYHKRLQDDRYFQASWRSLFLWDLSDKDAKGKFPLFERLVYTGLMLSTEFKASSKLGSLEDLGKYTDVAEKDPWWRFMFEGLFLVVLTIDEAVS